MRQVIVAFTGWDAVTLSLAALQDTPPFPPCLMRRNTRHLRPSLSVIHPSNFQLQLEALCSCPVCPPFVHPSTHPSHRQRPRWRVESASGGWSGGYLKPLDPSPLSPWKLQRGGAVSEQNNRSLPSSLARLARPQRERERPAPAREPPDPFLSPPYRDQRQYRKGPLNHCWVTGLYPYHSPNQHEVSPGRHPDCPFVISSRRRCPGKGSDIPSLGGTRVAFHARDLNSPCPPVSLCLY